MTETASYSDRHLDPREALAYRSKFKKNVLRRLSHARERYIIKRAFLEACESLPETLVETEGRPRLLDLPCGAGRFASMFADAANERGGRYIASDHSPSMLVLCERQLDEDRVVAEAFVESDAREMPFADGAFDIACCIRLIHHFRDPEERHRILSEFRRVNQGPLVMTFLDGDSKKQRRHVERCEREKKENRRATLTRAQLVEEARAAGYTVGKVRELSGRFSGQCVVVLTPE